MRISRDEMMMGFAELAAQRSTCNRAHVGAVIALDGRVISTGYAGAPSGMPHCSPDTCNLSAPCTRTIHAEMNAIVFAAKYGIAVEGTTLYCTLCPCLDCSKAIINSGIKRVIYGTPYRKVEGLELLRAAGVDTVHYQGLHLSSVWQLGVS